jgi:hypothetical protein
MISLLNQVTPLRRSMRVGRWQGKRAKLANTATPPGRCARESTVRSNAVARVTWSACGVSRCGREGRRRYRAGVPDTERPAQQTGGATVEPVTAEAQRPADGGRPATRATTVPDSTHRPAQDRRADREKQPYTNATGEKRARSSLSPEIRVEDSERPPPSLTRMPNKYGGPTSSVCRLSLLSPLSE